MTKKKRLTISFNDNDLKYIDFLKNILNTNQISKVIDYCINYTYQNYTRED